MFGMEFTMRKFKWSIASLFFITTLLVGFLVGHNRGFETGKNQWLSLPVYTKTYQVLSLISEQLNERNKRDGSTPPVTDEDFDEIIADLQSNVLPHVWEFDANTKVDAHLPSLSLIVTANGAMHDEIERHLAIEQTLAGIRIEDRRYPNTN